jgi:uncharacterized NAD-dependent epimerase/dehydratase family protein
MPSGHAPKNQISKDNIVTIKLPYLIFLGDVTNALMAKTGYGVRDWRPEACLAQCALPGCAADLGMKNMTPSEAAAAGAGSLLIGVASVGGQIKDSWVPVLVEALEVGLDIVSGMHSKLEDVDAIRIAAEKHGRTLHNVRHSKTKFPVGTGVKRPGKRLLAVGTDCALGKKYTTLALTKAFQEAGHKATFRATGQTGIMISGGGIAMDAVVADFSAGAAEMLSPANAPDHWDIIEGQGSLMHPGYAGVSLGLLHGSQPDALILCHDPFRTEIDEYPGFVIPPLQEIIDLHLLLARRTNPNVKCVAIALNTSKVSTEEGDRICAEYEAKYGLPTFDPMRSDLRRIVDAVVSSC